MFCEFTTELKVIILPAHFILYQHISDRKFILDVYEKMCHLVIKVCDGAHTITILFNKQLDNELKNN